MGNDEISEEEIEQRNPQSIRDVFDGETSITTSGGAAIANKVFVNGVEESLLSVTIDGARQNKSAFHHTGSVLIDPALLKSVEVSKGLAPADAGPNALAGSLAYETKDAADLLQDGDNFGGMTTLTLGTNEDRIRAGLTLSGYEVDNLYATYTPSKFDRLQMRLDVRNIFDATYTSRSSDGVGLGNVIALTEPGRSVSLTANLTF